MRLRCGGKFNNSLLQISSRFVTLEDFENRPVFDEVMPKMLLVRFFSGHGVCMGYFPHSISALSTGNFPQRISAWDISHTAHQHGICPTQHMQSIIHRATEATTQIMNYCEQPEFFKAHSNTRT